MPTLNKRALEDYLRSRFGPHAELLSYGVIGKESSKGSQKRYGYGTPVKLTFQLGRHVRSAVLETMRPGPFGHEHMADRAQAMLWDYDSYGRLPRHVKAYASGRGPRRRAPAAGARAARGARLPEVAAVAVAAALRRPQPGGGLDGPDADRDGALALGVPRPRRASPRSPDAASYP